MTIGDDGGLAVSTPLPDNSNGSDGDILIWNTGSGEWHEVGEGLTYDSVNHHISIENPVPAPAANHADAGKVLTVKTVDNVDEIVWDAPQGGGGVNWPALPAFPPVVSGGEYATLAIDLYTVGETHMWGDPYWKI